MLVIYKLQGLKNTPLKQIAWSRSYPGQSNKFSANSIVLFWSSSLIILLNEIVLFQQQTHEKKN